MTPAKQELGLYDSSNGGSVLAYKMADATEICKDSARCVIKYAYVERGRIAQICDWYKKDYDLGTTVHYFINEMNVSGLINDVVFSRQAHLMGADAHELASFIFNNQ